MPVTETIIDTTTPDGDIAVVRATPEDANLVGRVVLFQDAPGIRPSIHTFARRLANEGFDVAIPDLWHRHGRLIGYEPEDAKADPSVREHIMAMLQTFDDAAIQMDLDAALDVTGWGDESFATIGFCMGARAVHHTMIRFGAQVPAGAMWHPSFLADDEAGSPHLTAADLTGRLFVGIGTADTIQSIEMHQPYFDAVAAMDNVSVEIFDGADHGYTWPISPNYHEVAATRSWDATIPMFRAAFDG